MAPQNKSIVEIFWFGLVFPSEPTGICFCCDKILSYNAHSDIRKVFAFNKNSNKKKIHQSKCAFGNQIMMRLWHWSKEQFAALFTRLYISLNNSLSMFCALCDQCCVFQTKIPFRLKWKLIYSAITEAIHLGLKSKNDFLMTK